MEIIIAAVLLFIAIYILYKNIKKKASGKCPGCSDSSRCPFCSMYADKNSKKK
jgi:hypothetical protein